MMADKKSDPFDNWTTQARKGFIELCVLNVLLVEDKYGYDLVKILVSTPGIGVTEGTVYPLLSRLRVQGLVETYLVESSSGPARKYYSLTEEGRNSISKMNTYMDALYQGVHQIREDGKQ